MTFVASMSGSKCLFLVLAILPFANGKYERFARSRLDLKDSLARGSQKHTWKAVLSAKDGENQKGIKVAAMKTMGR